MYVLNRLPREICSSALLSPPPSMNDSGQAYVKTDEFNPNVAGLSSSNDAERIKNRFDGLRKHHHESAGIYSRTQPIINDQIHRETLKYLKSGQVNGSKAKSQRPRAPKRPRVTTSNPGSSSATAAITDNASQPAFISSPVNQPTYNQRMPQQNHHQYPNQVMQNHHQYPNQMIQSHHQYPNQIMQNHHQYPNQMIQNHHQHPNQMMQTQQSQMTYHRGNYGHTNPSTSLPNDLDLNLEAGLECDVESLINHEMSVEGALGFDDDLLYRLDNHQQSHYNH